MLIPLLLGLSQGLHPITLERSVGGYWAVEDTTLDSTTPTSIRGGDAILQGGPGRTILIQFHDLDRQLLGRRVHVANLKLTQTGGTPKLLACRRIAKGWSEGPIRVIGKGDPQARWATTWLERRSGPILSNWQLAGARGSEDGTRIEGVKVEDDGKGGVILTGLGEAIEWMRNRPNENHGFALEFSENVEFLSSEAQTGRPVLALETSPEPQFDVSEADLAIESISRLPEYPKIKVGTKFIGNVMIPADPENQQEKMWPVEGENVTYVALIRNRGSKAATAFDLAWTIRDQEVQIKSVTEEIAPNNTLEVKIEIPFKTDIFDHRRQSIELKLFPKAPDHSAANNVLAIQENGLSIGIELPAELEGKKDWVQMMVRTWNEVYARHSRFSFAPDGVKERVFVQKFSREPFSDAERDNLDAVLNLDANYFKSGEAEAQLKFLRELSMGLGLIDLSYPAYPMAADAFRGILGGDSRAEAGFPAAYSYPFDPAMDTVGDVVSGKARGLLSSVDVGALNGRVGRRRGYSGEYLFDIPEGVIINASDLAGNKISNAELTFTPLVNGQLATDQAFKLKATEGGTLVLPKKTVDEMKVTMTGSKLKPSPFGVIDIRGLNGAIQVETEVHGVKSVVWIKLWQLVHNFYRGQFQVGFISLRFNVPAAPPLTENLIPANSNDPLFDRSDEVATKVEKNSIEIDFGKEVNLGEIRFKAESLWQRFDIEVPLDENLGRPFAKEFAGDWAMTVRKEGDAVVYRGLLQKIRKLRIVNKGQGGSMILREIEARGVKM